MGEASLRKESRREWEKELELDEECGHKRGREGRGGDWGIGGRKRQREDRSTTGRQSERHIHTERKRRHVDCTAIAQKVGPGRARGMQTDPGRERERHLESQRWTHIERWRLRTQQLCSGQGDREDEEAVEPVGKGRKVSRWPKSGGERCQGRGNLGFQGGSALDLGWASCLSGLSFPHLQDEGLN